nr:RagB/SusD family nutrient uptake outer membrane protein [uncultured Flavobacterium sp.]
MKTIKFKYLFFVITLISLGSCSEEFVDITPKGAFLSDNYYADEDQATAALVGVYDIIRKNSGSFENMIAVMNAGSDDHYAGGGSATDGEGIQAFSKHTLTSINVLRPFWSDHYQGIFRANTLLVKLPNVAMADNLKARFAAEAKALRAIYYFNLVRMFKNVPLLLDPLTATNMYDVEQAAPEAVYAQIEKDLSEAIAVLPTTVPVATEGGRLTKGAAQAMLGKVYLYDNKKAEAAAVLAQVNGTPGATNQYGNKLLSNYSDLWVFANKFNAESLLEVVHTNKGNSDWWFWGSGADEGNTLNVMVGVRNYSLSTGSTAADLAPGWSFSVITQDLYDAIKLDPRFGATVFDMKAVKEAGQADYVAGYQDTGYFLNKFMPRNADKTTGGGAVEINYQQNSYVIRLADTYLMEAEALGSGARAQALLDAVRARVGLPSVPVTLAAIKNERRMELAGEGHRFFDLVRWGDAATKLANRGFVAGKDEIWPIPTSELQGTKLKQNPGYN